MPEPQIKSYMHCGKCLAELPSGESPASYARYAVGMTEKGLQVWCNRHEVNIAHFDLTTDPARLDTSLGGTFGEVGE